MIHPRDTRKGSVITHVAHTTLRQKALTCCGDVLPFGLNATPPRCEAWLTVCVPVCVTGGEDEVKVRTVQPNLVSLQTWLKVCDVGCGHKLT